LFKSENILYPSAYLVNSRNATFNGEVVNARLGEAKRVQKLLADHGTDTPMYMYSNLVYKDSKDFYKRVS
jgi:hypothetical protein